MHSEYTSYSPFFHRFIQADSDVLRLVFLVAAIVIYALGSSPTPDHPGIIEVIIAALLVLAVGFSSAGAALKIDFMAPFWKSAGQVLLVYGLTVPLAMAFIRDQDPALILRDVIPFLFLALPVFVASLFENRLGYFRCFLLSILFLGFVFALRALADSYGAVLSFLAPEQADELTYFANAPTVLFTALFLLGAGGRGFVIFPRLKTFLQAILFAALAMIVLLPVVLTLQRASLGYGALYIVVLLVIGFYYYPYRSFLLAIAAVIALMPVLGVLDTYIAALADKTSQVGLNMRLEELTAVWNEISTSFFTILCGAGWGGSFESPAVAGIRVNFTHGLLTSILLKTGMVGFVLVIFYLIGLARLLLSFLRKNPVLALALAGPVLIDVFFYASFKSLDFGLVLLMIPGFALAHPKFASKA